MKLQKQAFIGILSFLLTAHSLAIADKSDILYQVASSGCPYYVILGCYNTPNDAMRQSNNIGGRVINTSDISGFNPGYFCVVDGPYDSKRDAKNQKSSWKSRVRGAYVKQGCE